MTATLERGSDGHWHNTDGEVVWYGGISASDARKAIAEERRAFWKLARMMGGNPMAIGALAVTTLRVTDELQSIVRTLRDERG